MSLISKVKKKIRDNDFFPTLPWGLMSPFYITRKILANAIEKQATNIRGRVLDYGCGSKPYKSLFKHTEYIGVDIENPGHSHANENVDYFFDGLNLPFENESFDSCFSSEVFEHVFDIDKTLQEIKRVLKKNGKILITTPFVWDEHEAPHDYCRYTSFGLKNILERNGFSIINQKKEGTFFLTIIQLVLVFFNRITSNKRLLAYFFLACACPLLNTISLLDYLFFSKEGKTIYLSNVILAEKN